MRHHTRYISSSGGGVGHGSMVTAAPQCRVFCSIASIGARTGRLTVHAPPMQNLPHSVTIMSWFRKTILQDCCALMEVSKMTSAAAAKTVLTHSAHNREVILMTSRSGDTYRGMLEDCRPWHHDDDDDAEIADRDSDSHDGLKMQLTVKYMTQDDAPVNDRDASKSKSKSTQTVVDASRATWASEGVALRWLERQQLQCAMQGAYPVLDEARRHRDRQCRDRFIQTVLPRSVISVGTERVLISVDYAQIELRLATHFANCAPLIRSFALDKDPFRELAMDLLGRAKSRSASSSCSSREVPSELRDEVKTACYAYMYGSAAAPTNAFEHLCGEDRARMQSTVKRYFKPIKAFALAAAEDCMVKGYVETLMGRRRHLSTAALKQHGSRKDRSHRNRFARQVFNTLCQGSAADLVKVCNCMFIVVFITCYYIFSMQLAMVNAMHCLEEAGLLCTSQCTAVDHETVSYTSPSRVLSTRSSASSSSSSLSTASASSTMLVLQIHDELLLDVPRKNMVKVS